MVMPLTNLQFTLRNGHWVKSTCLHSKLFCETWAPVLTCHQTSCESVSLLLQCECTEWYAQFFSGLKIVSLWLCVVLYQPLDFWGSLLSGLPASNLTPPTDLPSAASEFANVWTRLQTSPLATLSWPLIANGVKSLLLSTACPCRAPDSPAFSQCVGWALPFF